MFEVGASARFRAFHVMPDQPPPEDRRRDTRRRSRSSRSRRSLDWAGRRRGGGPFGPSLAAGVWIASVLEQPDSRVEAQMRGTVQDVMGRDVVSVPVQPAG